MHRCLCVDEILRLIAQELVADEGHGTAAALACCSKSFEDPVLDCLWSTQDDFVFLLKTLPEDIWSPGRYESFERLPTTEEWARLRKYARRMRILDCGSQDLPSPQVLSILQLGIPHEPLFPNLETLILWIIQDEVIPFIPLFFSPRTTTTDLDFSDIDFHKITAAYMITTLPKLCPNLRDISLAGLPRDPAITLAISELVLNTKENTLLSFDADSSLTEQAYEVLYKHPHLRTLRLFLDRPNTFPTMELQNLTELYVNYYHDHDWLQSLCGASLGKLASITIVSESDPMDGFLGAFQTVALTTSIPASLSTFWFRTNHTWRPTYRSLLPFTRLTSLDIESPCTLALGCSSTIDDDTITDLARAMPKLQALRLGTCPCGIPGGVTVKGLVTLANYCPHLYELKIHFQVATLNPPEILSLISTDNSTTPRKDCAFRLLHVGRIPVPEESALRVASALVIIFPRLKYINYRDGGWKKVLKAIDSRERLLGSPVTP